MITHPNRPDGTGPRVGVEDSSQPRPRIRFPFKFHCPRCGKDACAIRYGYENGQQLYRCKLCKSRCNTRPGLTDYRHKCYGIPMSAVKLASHQALQGSKRGPQGGVTFDGKIINLKEIAVSLGLHASHLSRAFRGERLLSIQQAVKIANYLGMELVDFIQAFQTRVQGTLNQPKEIIQQYEDRIQSEVEEDTVMVRKGKSPTPRLPGLRLKD